MKRRIDTTRERELRAFPLFAACSSVELADIDGQMTEIAIKAGEVIIQEGRIGRQSFIVVEGEASVTAGGREIARLGPGEFFGEMAVLTQRPRSASVRAITDMRVLVLEPRELGAVLKVPTVTRAMLHGVVGRLYDVEGQLA